MRLPKSILMSPAAGQYESVERTILSIELSQPSVNVASTILHDQVRIL